MNKTPTYEPDISEAYKQILSIDRECITLKHGEIDLYIEDATYHSYTKKSWAVEYKRPDLDYFKYGEADSLQKAFEMYLKWDTNAKGMW